MPTHIKHIKPTLYQYLLLVLLVLSDFAAMAQNNLPSDQVAHSINNAQMLYDSGNLSESIRLFEENLTAAEGTGDINAIIYCQGKLYHLYFETGQYNKSARLEDILLSRYAECLNGTIHINPDILLCLATEIVSICKIHNEYDTAIKVSEDIRGLDYRIYSEEEQYLRFPNLYNLATLYIDTFDYEKAQTVIDEATELATRFQQPINALVDIQLLQVVLDANTGNLGKAVDICSQIYTHQAVSENPTLKLNVADIYTWVLSRLGDSEKALRIREDILPLTEAIYGNTSTYYGIALINLSENYALCGEWDKAESSCRRAVDIYQSTLGQLSREYYHAYGKLASLYAYKNPEQSFKMRHEMIEMARNIFGERTNEYAEALIYSVDMNTEDVNKAIQLLEKGLSIKRALGLVNDEQYFTHLSWLPLFYRVKNDWAKTYDADRELLDCGKRYVATNFFNMLPDQRQMLWSKIKMAFDGIASDADQHTDYVVATKDFTLYQPFAELAYDTRLFLKGLLLSSTSKIVECLRESADESILANLADVQNTRRRLESNDMSSEDAARLQAHVDSAQWDLLHAAQTYGGLSSAIDVNWRDVQKHLLPGQVAMEIFGYLAQGRIQYSAVWIRSEGHPLICPLFCEDEFVDALGSHLDFSNPKLFNMLWGTLENSSFLDGIDTIYFSLDGNLNSWPIESLCNAEGMTAGKMWEMVRLSSTRELVKPHIATSITDVSGEAVLFGGLQYDDNAPLALSSQTTAASTPTARYGVKYLPYTLQEVSDIKRMITNAGIRSTTYVGPAGTEAQFNALSGADVSILHLATHGFCWSQDEVANRSYIDFISHAETKSGTFEEQALQRAGLILSGANVSLSGEKSQMGKDDGIVTANELCTMDFSSIQLVVLSACDTGLGETNGEGVFGLQRGFKLAGAKSLLMSLWKVDDEATKVLMTEFYRYLLDGKSKTESLRLAQEYVKSQPEWFTPKYWAGFILLDALD